MVVAFRAFLRTFQHFLPGTRFKKLTQLCKRPLSEVCRKLVAWSILLSSEVSDVHLWSCLCSRSWSLICLREYCYVFLFGRCSSESVGNNSFETFLDNGVARGAKLRRWCSSQSYSLSQMGAVHQAWKLIIEMSSIICRHRCLLRLMILVPSFWAYPSLSASFRFIIALQNLCGRPVVLRSVQTLSTNLSPFICFFRAHCICSSFLTY